MKERTEGHQILQKLGDRIALCWKKPMRRIKIF